MSRMIIVAVNIILLILVVVIASSRWWYSAVPAGDAICRQGMTLLPGQRCRIILRMYTPEGPTLPPGHSDHA